MVNCTEPRLFVALQTYFPVSSSLTFFIVRHPFWYKVTSIDLLPRDHSIAGWGEPVAAQHNSKSDPGLTETCEGAFLVNTGSSRRKEKKNGFEPQICKVHLSLYTTYAIILSQRTRHERCIYILNWRYLFSKKEK